MNKQHYIKRLIYGYNCRLVYDKESECYLITADKFPNLLEDGITKGDATRRMKEAIRKELEFLKQEHSNIPEEDEPDWAHIMESLNI